MFSFNRAMSCVLAVSILVGTLGLFPSASIYGSAVLVPDETADELVQDESLEVEDGDAHDPMQQMRGVAQAVGPFTVFLPIVRQWDPCLAPKAAKET